MVLDPDTRADISALVENITIALEEQAMENAVAAVLTGNISQRSAAKRFGVKQQTLSDRLKKASGDVDQMSHHTTQESKPARLKNTGTPIVSDQGATPSETADTMPVREALRLLRWRQRLRQLLNQ